MKLHHLLVVSIIVLDVGISNIITLPVENGYVTAQVDGQKLDLMMDSGSGSIKVVDGNWYEEAFGENACDKPQTACYFCPSTAPCLSGTRGRSTFGDGSEFTFVHHKVTLTLGGVRIDNFDVEVVTDFSSPIPGDIPRGLFGMSLSCLLGGDSMIGKLKALGAIGQLSYYLHTRMDPNVNGIWGDLVLGPSTPKLHAPLLDTRIETCHVLGRAVPAVWTSAIRLFRANGATVSRTPIQYTARQASLGFLDTGSQGLVVQDRMIINELISYTKNNMTSLGYSPEKRDQMLREVEGRWYISSMVLSSLPTIGVIVSSSDKGDIRINIEPKMYTLCTEHVYCLITVRVRGRLMSHASTLGVPFFRGHSIYVDYGSKKLRVMRNQL